MSNQRRGTSDGEGPTKQEAQDELLVAALASGQTYAEAGSAAQLSERTVRRRMSDPRFAALVAQHRSAHVAAVTGTLLAASGRAVEVILGCLDADKPTDRLRAAELLLTLARRYHSDVDVDARLTALESPTPQAEDSTHEH